VGEIQGHHTGWVIRARLLARLGTILPDGDDSDRSRDARAGGRRHDLQVCGEATAGEGFVTLGQGLNYAHWDVCFYFG
jgi:hypothetical protein